MLAKIIVSLYECEIYFYGGIGVLKYLGEGPILVLVECINEINAIATKRVDVQIGADRDVQQGGTAYPF